MTPTRHFIFSIHRMRRYYHKTLVHIKYSRITSFLFDFFSDVSEAPFSSVHSLCLSCDSSRKVLQSSHLQWAAAVRHTSSMFTSHSAFGLSSCVFMLIRLCWCFPLWVLVYLWGGQGVWTHQGEGAGQPLWYFSSWSCPCVVRPALPAPAWPAASTHPPPKPSPSSCTCTRHLYLCFKGVCLYLLQKQSAENEREGSCTH